MIIPADSPRLTWQGAISLEHGDGWVKPWRIPYKEAALFPPADRVPKHAQLPAGVRISFRTDTRSVAVNAEVVSDVSPMPQQYGLIDVCSDGAFHCTARPQDGRYVVRGLPQGRKVVEIWLPQAVEIRVKSIEVDDGASVGPNIDKRPKWVVYGSSITQCAKADSPSNTWPGVASRSMGLDLTCLGYGGSCYMEPMVARMVRDLPADYLTMKVGVNIYSVNALSLRTFRAAAIGFVKIVREKHPGTPYIVTSPIWSAPKETTPNAAGLTLQAMRSELAEAVAALRALGDRNVHYLDGLKLLGPESPDLMGDPTHPNADGYRHMGEAFVRETRAVFGR
ncbi:MAG: GDSL family lipase [SAR202 cluster bacterium]|nr:GDSL family lipase [SAR202 cluster bacterium]